MDNPNPGPSLSAQAKGKNSGSERVRTILLAARNPYPSIPTHLRATWEQPNPGPGAGPDRPQAAQPNKQELGEKA